MSRTGTRTLLLGLAALGVLETVAGAAAYSDAIVDSDWSDLRAALEQDDADAIQLATPWLGPRARMEIPALALPDAAAPADLAGIRTLSVVGLHDDLWSSSLDRALEGRHRPNLLERTQIGPFTLTRYEFEGSPRTLASWIETHPKLSTPSGTCTYRRGWKCKEGKVQIEYAEVDYTPRRCFSLELADATPLRFSAPQMPLGTALVGHVGVSDFNGRLRSDAPIRVDVAIDGQDVARFATTDAQGWHPFIVQTQPGKASVDVVITDTVRGTWGRNGLEPRGRSVCFELRAIEEGTP